MLSDLRVSCAPHISKPHSTQSIMLDVIIGLVPAIAAAGYYFRIYALILSATCIISSVATELLWDVMRGRKKPTDTLKAILDMPSAHLEIGKVFIRGILTILIKAILGIFQGTFQVRNFVRDIRNFHTEMVYVISEKLSPFGDFSAMVTGIILALSLPPSLPIWAAIIGSVFSIAIGKMVFGGLGSNIFNPAMAGRAFLTACFGMLMTTWTVPATIDTTMPKITALNTIHARTQATPLAWSKQAIKEKTGAEVVNEQLQATFTGEVGGCLGETSALALLLGGLYLLLRQTINWRIPLAVLAATFVFGAAAYLLDKTAYIWPLTHLTSGGMLLCAFFIATDPVTAPLTRKGMWIFGIGVGAITMLIRIVGEYPEGIMYAVLLMNAVTPLIDRLCKRIPAGGKPSA